jgi:hypothetical protein
MRENSGQWTVDSSQFPVLGSRFSVLGSQAIRCLAAEEGVGVLRLRRANRFATGRATLRMTDLFIKYLHLYLLNIFIHYQHNYQL